MKMTLAELYAKCTPLPLKVVIGAEYCFHNTCRVSLMRFTDGDDIVEPREETVAEVWPADNDIDIYDAHRFAHAIAVLPEVEALLNRIASVQANQNSEPDAMGDALIEIDRLANDALRLINNINVTKEKGIN